MYAAYSYLVVGDDICVVDPGTYEVVDIIPAGTLEASGPYQPRLALTPEQMHFVYDTVPRDLSADVRIRLALGAAIPTNVPVLPFPEQVLARVPQLGGFGFVVVGSDVAVVDPSDRSVVLVITE